MTKHVSYSGKTHIFCYHQTSFFHITQIHLKNILGEKEHYFLPVDIRVFAHAIGGEVVALLVSSKLSKVNFFWIRKFPDWKIFGQIWECDENARRRSRFEEEWQLNFDHFGPFVFFL